MWACHLLSTLVSKRRFTFQNPPRFGYRFRGVTCRKANNVLISTYFPEFGVCRPKEHQQGRSSRNGDKVNDVTQILHRRSVTNVCNENRGAFASEQNKWVVKRELLLVLTHTPAILLYQVSIIGRIARQKNPAVPISMERSSLIRGVRSKYLVRLPVWGLILRGWFSWALVSNWRRNPHVSSTNKRKFITTN